MADYADSSQLNLWVFQSPDELAACRSKANLKAREFLSKEEKPATLPVEQFASGWSRRVRKGEEILQDYSSQGPKDNTKGDPYLTEEEEAILVSFYVSKMPSLIGPAAQIPRLRRESKVTATSAMLLRRFFLSNSVMLFDPKTIMTSAAFLGSKVEDATADVRYLEEGTTAMNAPVPQTDIISGEISLLQGAHFDLLCFHPYKSVLALTEDMRTYLKSDKGQALVEGNRPLSGGDLKPIYDAARALLDDVVVSDLPLLSNPGQIGLAALMVAQDSVLAANASAVRIDLRGYIRQRFEGEADDEMLSHVDELCRRLKALQSGAYGCANHGIDMTVLKGIHKKLKTVRIWGQKEKKKKRSSDEKGGNEAKRQKTN